MASFGELAKAAFNARPLGMPIPPNWLGLAAFGLLGLINPGLWVVGAGIELGYLAWLIHSPRFRATVIGRAHAGEEREQRERATRLLEQLTASDRDAYRRLEERCRGILAQQSAAEVSPAALASQAEGLNRLLWISLRLFATRAQIQRLGADDGVEQARLRERAATLERQLAGTDVAEELRRSLEGQLAIVRQRLAKRGEAEAKLDFLDAELDRIAQQVELIREQAMLAGDPQGVSARIDEVTATLGGTSDWIRDQQAVLGQVEDVAAPPALLGAARPRHLESPS